MKRILLMAAVIGISAGVLIGPIGANVAEGADNSKMHEMMMSSGGPKADARVELQIPAPMKVMQKEMMRQHLDTISEITGALAANDLTKASTIAKEKLGWNPAEEQRCNAVAEMTKQPDFIKFGKAVHLKADELSEAAKAGDRNKALIHLAELIKNCNACHGTFRH